MQWAVLLAGGSGTRFWPLSSPNRPKQLLPLAGPRSSAEEAVDRLAGFIPPERILIVTGQSLAAALQAKLPVPTANYLIEPRAASTGPALVWATLEAARRDPEAEVISMHADWSIRDPAAFVATAATALDTARRHERLVTVGIVPSRPETGFGYIVPGARLDGAARAVDRFIEKPNAATALDLMADGALWNSGLFAWRATDLRREVELHTDEIAPWLAPSTGRRRRILRRRPRGLDRRRRVRALGRRGGGAWRFRLGRHRHLGGDGARAHRAIATATSIHGPVTLVDCADCIVWNDGPPMVLSGVRDLVVVHANNRTLVLDRSRAPALKQTLDALPPEVRELE